ncbi:MAG TPA: ABC transporter permease subunit [Ktedonobacteraceae bacterium]|jgi:ABC-2 type transport system permease protein|nr:ABC transporter permease subunit [Ktedonobacteraceae bacterium]
MWFNNVFLKTLRDYRIAILGWGIGIGLLMYAVLTAVSSLIATPAARASLVALAAEFTWIADPVAVDTPGGYATWKYGFTILIIALWPLLACSRILRGEEERGSLDALLSQPVGRTRVVLEKLAAIWTALLLMGLLIALLTFAGGQRVNADFGFSGAMLFGLNIVLISGLFGSIALLLSQFTQERSTAAGWTGALLLIFIVLDMVHRVYSGTEWLSRLSPVYYYNLSKPLIPGYGTNAGAMLLLLSLNMVLSGAAIWLFARRDIGGTVALPGFLHRTERVIPLERALPVNDWSLRSVYTRSLGMIGVSTFWWTVAIAGLAAWMVAIVKQVESNMVSLLQGSPMLKELITKVGGGDQTTNATLLSFFFVFLPVLLMAFAVVQASKWASDEEEGRLELVLATPQPRLQVMLGRFAALATATIIISVITLAASALASAASGLHLDGGNLAAASLGLIPMGLLMAALGYLFSGWLRAAVDTGILSFLLVIWFFITFVGPELNWSEATLRLSAFYYYGTPLLHGLPVGDMLAVLAVAVVALVLASVRFMRKDIGR